MNYLYAKTTQVQREELELDEVEATLALR
ncbi:Protein of unknown function [Lactobacillus helveticus CIRM-BIA 101]|uniref:Uncharacterized protein n=3 Tax=Lactobacillus helveticus TaxID=1587 RepID=U4QA71_LACHE|nr:Protein of unknown function [Lactobacillus helveticus CIRM-BIA 953]CDI59274.1 Protein of unknown function [Lactobacillus helveticus CIRM-BIA 951]CDI61144.1 Protein of unknown function [Lactobacillus helveticus CIRM-BIA 104]CDI63104.1 Protein of unknown function [Lactobacillus helveticus CIRM-BIA 103]CDI66005.1 Protein of unknown function [Lactobacillus helveticus CIRM-BIA 101]CDR72198.1 Protein of unknown function [Lactobacillus delbrueckii subsp. bulgaricus]